MEFPLNIGGIPCKLLHDGSGKQTSDGGRTDVYACAWEHAAAFRLGMTGYTYNDHGGNRVIVPARKSDDGKAIVDGADIEPLGKPTGTPSNPGTWEFAKVTVTYKPTDDEDDDDDEEDEEDLKEESVSLSAEVATTQKEGWEFENGQGDPAKRAVDRDVQVIVPLIQYSVTWYKIPSLEPMLAKAIQNIGKVGSLKGSGDGCAIYLGLEARRKITTQGVKDWTVTNKADIGFRDLRKDFDPHTGTWQKVKKKVAPVDGSSPYRYDEGDFSGLF